MLLGRFRLTTCYEPRRLSTAGCARQPLRGLLAGIAVAVLAGGCASTRMHADEAAAAAGFARALVRGAPFVHVTYSAGASGSRAPVWIYVEGDGIPWIDESIPATDPTPRLLVALDMMRNGPAPAAYLGRPCYFGTASLAPCAPTWWTHRRFAPAVVDSMVAALDRLLAERGWTGRSINLVGFSGGGTLATLMAGRLAGVCALITLASPLDVDEWAAGRGYTPLAGSENPALRPALPERLHQLHLRGERDTIVPADNGVAFRRRNPGAQFRVLPGLAHGAAWVGVWSGLLRYRDEPALSACF